MANYLFPILFTLTIPISLPAQTDQNFWESAVLVKLGIVRMETRQTTLANSPREKDRILNSETLFDSSGRTLKISNDACRACGTTYTYDSLRGLNTFTRYIWSQGYRDTYTEYDTFKRHISSEICTNGLDDCAYYTYEYDEENTERMYKHITKRHLKRDTAKQSNRFLRLYGVNEEKKQLIHERYFSPEGQLEETKNYLNGKFENSSFYEYDVQGRVARVWHFDGKIKQISNEGVRNEMGQLIFWKSYIISSGDPLHTLSKPNVQAYEYDDNGLLIKSTSNRIITEYTYFTE